MLCRPRYSITTRSMPRGEGKQNVAPSHQHTRGQCHRVTTRHVGELTITDICDPWYKVRTHFMFCDSVMGVLWWGVTTHYRQWTKRPIAALYYTRLQCGGAQLVELHTDSLCGSQSINHFACADQVLRNLISDIICSASIKYAIEPPQLASNLTYR